jgi:hypothetical protein
MYSLACQANLRSVAAVAAFTYPSHPHPSPPPHLISFAAVVFYFAYIWGL